MSATEEPPSDTVLVQVRNDAGEVIRTYEVRRAKRMMQGRFPAKAGTGTVDLAAAVDADELAHLVAEGKLVQVGCMVDVTWPDGADGDPQEPVYRWAGS